MNYWTSTYSIPEEVVKLMYKNGDLSPTKDYHFEIYNFYKDILANYENEKNKFMNAHHDTCIHYKISQAQLYNIRKEFENTQEN